MIEHQIDKKLDNAMKTWILCRGVFGLLFLMPKILHDPGTIIY